MRISRHPISREPVDELFSAQRELLPCFVDRARTTTQALSPVALVAELMYQAGGVADPECPDVKRAITLASEANTAILVFGLLKGSLQCPLGDGPLVSCSEPVDESHAHVGRWIDAFELATIGRRTDLLTTLENIPNELLQRSTTDGAKPTYLWVDLLRAIGEGGRITGHPAFIAYEEYCANCEDHSAHCVAIRDLAIPFLQVLRQLERGDEAGFSNALVDALEMHKKYWGSTLKLRKDFHGFVSLRLTMAAALAWDRGLRFDVESDYIPTSWVRGDLFSDTAGRS